MRNGSMAPSCPLCQLPSRLCSVTVMALMCAGSPTRADDMPAYCPELRQVAAAALARDKFAGLIGAPRDGNYLQSNVALSGWQDCAFYGARTYTCDSHPIDTTTEAGRAFERTLGEVKGCLREGWTEDASRASPGYAVGRDDRQIASITINTDRIDTDRYVVRLILFLRSR
jgi:hypothetical protein